MTNADVRQLTDKLDVLVRLMAVSVVHGKTRREQIRLLSGAGLQPKVIAELIGTTPNTVSVELFSIRKEARDRRSGPRAKKVEEQESRS